MLELQFDPATRSYSAPIQLKANNGFLLIDDLGRQRIAPSVLFNRWIVPMDSQQDSLVTNRGHHFQVPFDLVLVFSTNLRPEDIADQAFLRRLGYKIEMLPIQPDEYQQIWQRVCAGTFHRLRRRAGRLRHRAAAPAAPRAAAALPSAGPRRHGARSRHVPRARPARHRRPALGMGLLFPSPGSQ